MRNKGEHIYLSMAKEFILVKVSFPFYDQGIWPWTNEIADKKQIISCDSARVDKTARKETKVCEY